MHAIENFTFEEENLIVQSATKRKEEQRHIEKVREKHFVTRNTTIQHYFLRLSCGNKRQFFLKLMDRLGSLASTVELLQVMSLEHAKTAIYAAVDPSTDFVYDKLVVDHDRMLDQKTLTETMENDLAWFSTLEDQYQATLIIGLLRLSGGNVKRTLYLPIFRKYHEKLKVYRAQETRQKTKDVSVNIHKKIESVEEEEEDEQYDPLHPATIEVEKQRRKWDDMINKYRQEVEGTAKSIEIGRDKEEKKGKGLKTEKKPKKGAKTSKSTKKVGKKEESKDQKIDMLQLLPIWIVKKILGYLNEKTLQTVKHVNNYWSYVVQDILKERKTRERLNRHLANMKSRIDPEKLEEAMKKSAEMSLKRPKHKRNDFFESAAISSKLVPKPNKNMVEKSLISDAAKEREDQLGLHTGELVPFPRLIRQDVTLYKHHTCFLQDVNLRFDEEELEKHKSFLTYSLSSALGSLKMSVDEDVLENW